MKQVSSNYARFLVLLRVLVDETRKDEPMSMVDIQKRLQEYGAYLDEKTILRHIEYMEEGGVLIARRLPDKKQRGSYLYWYEDGWV